MASAGRLVAAALAAVLSRWRPLALARRVVLALVALHAKEVVRATSTLVLVDDVGRIRRDLSDVGDLS